MTFLTNEDLQELEQARKEKEQNAFVLNRQELSYVMRLVAKEHLEKKRKLEIAKQQFERVDDFFQRLANAHYEFDDVFEQNDEN